MQNNRAVVEEDAPVHDGLTVHRNAYVVVRNTEEMNRLVPAAVAVMVLLIAGKSALSYLGYRCEGS